jgi:catechol 2,3-dioxygenase-like lactoylglutathione lyase family enzyme
MPRPPLPLTSRVALHLVVSDMKRSIDFYVRELGFFYDHGQDNLAWLLRDGLQLTLSPGTPQRELNSYWGWRLERPEELTDLYERLSQRGLLLGPPPDAAAGRTYFFLYDPDNYPLVFSLDTLEHPEGKL